MEVRVEALGGQLPDGSYVAVRIGDVQKQTVYDPSKVFKFTEIRRFGRIEVFQRAGTCDLVWGGDEPETQVCKLLDSGLGADMQLRLFTRPTCVTSKCGDFGLTAAASGDSLAAARKDNASTEAKKYIKDNDVEGMLSGALRALLKVMPMDAPGFLSDYFHTNYCKKVGKRGRQSPAKQPAAKHPVASKEVAVQVKPRQAPGKEVQTSGPQVSFFPFSEYYTRHILPSRGSDFFSTFHNSASWKRRPTPGSDVVNVSQIVAVSSPPAAVLGVPSQPSPTSDMIARPKHWSSRPSCISWAHSGMRRRYDSQEAVATILEPHTQSASSEQIAAPPSFFSQYYSDHVLPGQPAATFLVEFHQQHFPKAACFLPGDRVKLKGAALGTIEANNGDCTYTVVQDASGRSVGRSLRITCSRSDLMKVSTCPKGHTLKYQRATERDWACDTRKDDCVWNRCRSGITGFGQTTGMSRYFCAECDYSVCELCFRYREGFWAGLYEPGQLVKAAYRDLPDWQLAEITQDLGDGTYRVDWHSGASDNRVLHCAEICIAPKQINDEGAPVALGNRKLRHLPGGDGTGRYYCGRECLQGVMDSHGARCGPDGGPQCKSCQRFQQMYFPNGGLPFGWTADWDNRTNEPFYVKGKLSQWQRPLPDVTCPHGHRLEPLGQMPTGWSCHCSTEPGGCSSSPGEIGHAGFGCERCNYHMCEKCLLLRSGNDAPQIKNDDGAPLECKSYGTVHFCGRQLPNDLSCCSPAAGSQCFSCERFNLQEAEQPLCPTCKKPMHWTNCKEGAYEKGWYCNNSLTCNGGCIKQGWSRWVCEPCQNDLCMQCGETAMRTKERTRVLTSCHSHNLYRYQDDSKSWFCSIQSHRCTRQSGGHADRWSCRQCKFDLCAACKEFWRVDAVQVSTHPHALQPHTSQDTTWQCSDRCAECTRDAAGPTVRWSCNICRYDLCRACVDHWQVVAEPTSNDLRQASWLYNLQKSLSEKLMQSMRTGELQNVLTRSLGGPGDTKESVSPSWRFKPSVGTWLNRLPSSKSSVFSATARALCAEAVRSHVCTVLNSAVAGGRWQESCSNEHKSEGPLAVGILRAVALEILMQKSQHGTLQENISRLLQVHNIHVPHFDANEALLKALGDGSLDEALIQMHRRSAEEGIDALRSQICGALMKAADDCTLHRIFSEIDTSNRRWMDPQISQPPAITPEALAERSEKDMSESCQGMLNVLQNEGLDSALREDLQEAEIIHGASDAPRDYMRQQDIRQDQDGSTCNLISDRSKITCDVGEQNQEKSDSLTSDFDDLRTKVFDAMVEAAADGNLQRIFSEVPTSDFDDLRVKLLDTMVEAADDGNLQNILFEAAQQQQDEADILDCEGSDRDPIEKFRSWAQDVLLSAHADGTLQQALSSACDGQAARQL